MHSSKNYAIVFFAFTTAVLSLFAWHQHLELHIIRRDTASTLDRGKAAPIALDTGSPRERRTPGDNPATRFAAFARNPAFMQLWTAYQKLSLDAHYGVLFKQLKLSASQLDAFKDLLVQKQLALAQALDAARAQGRARPGDFAAIHRLAQQVQDETDAGIRQALGRDKFARYENYERTFPERTIINQLSARLLYTDSPLQDQQVEQLVQLMANHLLPSGPDSPLGPNIGISDQFIAQAKAVLTPTQLDALRSLQQQQLDERQLSQMLSSGRP